jgi:hypothetical protein
VVDNRLIQPNRARTQPTRYPVDSYTLFCYNANGQISRRDRRFDNGTRQHLDFYWDGDDRLREVQDHDSAALFFRAWYDGAGLRVKKTDTRGALGLQVHDYSYGPMGLLWEGPRHRRSVLPGHL